MPGQEFADRHADICELRRGVCRNRMARIAFETDQRRVRNERCRFHRIIDRIVQVEAGNEEQCGRLDGQQRSRRVAVEPGCRPYPRLMLKRVIGEL